MKRILSRRAARAKPGADGDMGRVVVDRRDLPSRVRRGGEQGADADAAAQFEIAGIVVRLRQIDGDVAEQAGQRHAGRRLLDVKALDIGDVGDVAAGPRLAHAASFNNFRSRTRRRLASLRRRVIAGCRQPGVPAQQRPRAGGPRLARRRQDQRRNGVAGEHGIDGKAHFEADKGADQRHQLAQQRPIRQKPLEVGQDRAARSRSTIRACWSQARTPAAASTTQLAERAGRHAHRQTRALIDRQGHPGAGELLDLDRPPQPVGGQCFQPIRRARMGREKTGVVAQRRRTGEQAFGQARGRVAGQGQQHLGHRIAALPARRQRADIGGAVRAVFRAGRGEGRDHAMRNQVQEIASARTSASVDRPRRHRNSASAERRPALSGRSGRPSRAAARRRHRPARR